MQCSGKTGTGVRDRDMGIEKQLGGRIYIRMLYEAAHDKTWMNGGGRERQWGKAQMMSRKGG